MVDFWSKKIHLQQPTCNNSPDLCKITRVRWSISKGPLTTIHQIRGKSKSKMVHLEGSMRNNSPDSGKIRRARRSISKGRGATIHQIWAKSKASWATSRANDLSLSADMR
eukprot:scaffold8480_cov106-Cylindrotheca_fusiformis.AAC.1